MYIKSYLKRIIQEWVTSPSDCRCDHTLIYISHIVFPFTARPRVCVFVCNHSDVAHSALDRSHGICADEAAGPYNPRSV